MRTGTRCTKVILNQMPADSWEIIKQDYNKACQMPCTPDASFPRVSTGDVIDEEKSVRWNREEVERLQAEYNAEVLRLKEERSREIQRCTERAVAKISEETGLSTKKASIIWDFVYGKYHACGEVFDTIEEYVDFVYSLLEV